MRAFPVIGVLALVLIGTNAHGQITKQGNQYLFRLKLVKGQTVKLNMTTQVNAQGMNQSLDIPMLLKTTNVVKDVADFSITVGPSKMNGKEVQPSQTQSVKINTLGKVVSGQGLGGNATVPMPEKPVKVGDSWSADVSNALQGANMKVKATYTFKGLKTIGGKQCVELAVATNASGQVNMKGAGTIYLLMSDGYPFQSNLKIDLEMTNPQGNMKMNTVTTIKRG